MPLQPDRDVTYRLHILVSTVTVLALAIAFVLFWPHRTTPSTDLPFTDAATDFVEIEEIIPTNQSQDRKPPPPAPLPPVVVPEDVLVEIEFDGSSHLTVDAPGEDATLQDGAQGPTVAKTSDIGARLFRSVQPTYPERAQKDDVRARVIVEVAVDASGRVTGATVLRCERITSSGSTSVPSLSYGLEESALDAARRSLFRPAERNGEPVATRTTITFTFGDSGTARR